jgi:hypothetical protein
MPVLVLVAAAVAGCVSHSGYVDGCSLVGARSGVAVAGGHTRGVVTVCDGRECGSVLVGAGTRFVDLPYLRAGKNAVFRATFKAGRSVVTSEVVAATRTVQPNGPGCPPTAVLARIAVEHDGRAVAARP